MENKLFAFLLLGLLLISFASAEQVYKVDEATDLKVTCLNNGFCSSSSYCSINIINPDGETILVNANMTNQNSFHNYTVTPSDIGVYNVNGFCLDGAYSEEVNYDFEVTYDGEKKDIASSVIYIILLSLIVGIFLFLYSLNKRMNYKRWYDNIIVKYKNRNYIKMAFSGIGYNLIKNTFAIYYFLGLVALLIITDIIFSYNIISLITIIQNVMLVYTIGILVVTFMLFGEFQEFFMHIYDDAKNSMWGIE